MGEGGDLSWWNPDEPIRGPRKSKRPLPKPRGHAAVPGTGPEGERCGTCRHLARIRYSRTYLKCDLVRTHWTGGPATDIRAKDPACKRWEAET